MKILKMKKLKNESSSERELKNHPSHSFWKGKVKYKGKSTRIVFALCHDKIDLSKNIKEQEKK